MFLKISIICLSFFGAALGQCVFRYGGNLPQTQEPVYVRRSNLLIYAAQNQQGQFSVAQNEDMLFLCTNPANRNNNYVILRVNNVNTNTRSTILEAKCFSNRILLRNNQQVNFADIGCANMPQSEIIDNVNRNNPNAPKVIQIGFRVSPTMFIERYRVLFNPVLKTTYYAFSYLQSTPYSCVTDERPSFKADGFGLTATTLKKDYTRKSNQTGIQIDRGHLVSKCDFFTKAEQYSTFYYVNTNPQMHTRNSGNWKNLETYIRNAVNGVNGLVLEAYTGASLVNPYYGYLHVSRTSLQVPVPFLFWKVLINPVTKAGVAFIGMNDNQRAYHPLCFDVCRNIQWLRDFNANIRKRVVYGQVYCCTIDQFVNITYIVKPLFKNYIPGKLLTRM